MNETFYFNWSDYNLNGPPALSLEDYTFQALGLDELFQEFIGKIKISEERCEKIRWRIIDYWGAGKSTFAYNLCYQINNHLFFGDSLENPSFRKYAHVLALYLKTPQRKREMLKNIIENGLPVPWKTIEEKELVEKERKTLLKMCIRKLMFLMLRKSQEYIDKGYIFRDLPLSKQVDIASYLRKFRNLSTQDFLLNVDELVESKNLTYDDLERILSSYLDLKNCKSEHFEKLIYPIDSPIYLETFQRLAKNQLLDIDIFRRICENADTTTFLIIDEVEDWSTIIKYKLDYDLLDLANSPDLSLILIFRTEVMKMIKNEKALQRYLNIIQTFEDVTIPELKMSQVLEITKGFLLTARGKKEPSLYPFSENAIRLIAGRTKRGGKFNTRLYFRALTEILQKSLTWKRDTPLLDEYILTKFNVTSVISEVIIQEIRREREAAQLDIEKLHRFGVASLIAKRLLAMRDPPRSKIELESIKAEYARKMNTGTPSNMEIIASVDDETQRKKLINLIEKLT